MQRYDVFLEGRTENSTCYFGVAVMADDRKEAEYLGHEAGRVKHQECDEIEVVGVMPVTSNLNAGKRRLCWRIPLKERALKFVKEAIKNGRKRLIDADDLIIAFGNALNNAPLKIGYGFMEQVVNEQPTVDPESMRGHARWLKDENVKIIDVDAYGNTFESQAVYCENCNAALSEADFRGRVWNFCPVCGFKMEDETEEQHETD